VTAPGHPVELDDLRERWLGAWPAALAAWSRYTRLSEPRWCNTEEQERAEHLVGSFAMIRFEDHAVVVSLRQVRALGLEDCAPQVLAHEVGHHVLCPGDLTDHARMLARVRRGLPTRESRAPLVANLFSDLIVNDRLQRVAAVPVAEVYRRLARGGPPSSALWTLYMRICEILWGLARGSLATGAADAKLEGDAQLGARLVRVYAADWLRGAGRFAVLLLPYLLQEPEPALERVLGALADTKDAGRGAEPAGLAELDADEEQSPPHPSEDPEVTGLDEPQGAERPEAGGATPAGETAPRRRYREPPEFAEILRGAGIEIDEEQAAVRYYRELALPHLVPLPTRRIPRAAEPLPEGLETWQPGEPLEEIDWVESVVRNPRVVPGVTTLRRTWGESPGFEPERRPTDLYVGIDCSGSMVNPRRQLSYPVLAGAILALSALRAGGRVMAVLSGDPGGHAATEGFVRDERAVLRVLTGYLGSGYAFGIRHLATAFAPGVRRERPAHVVVVTDHDIFAKLEEQTGKQSGWEIARAAVAAARGGGTFVLHMRPDWEPQKTGRLRADGWAVHCVLAWEDVVALARTLAHARWGDDDERR
jgi:hypothetical protein